MRRTLEIIESAYNITPNCCIAFSGGTDSSVLLDIIYRRTDHRPPVYYCDDQMAYPETLDFVKSKCEEYGADLTVARAKRTPQEQWKKGGYAMLGKLAARIWEQNHRDLDFGYKLDVTACCRNMKIAPVRKQMRKDGLDLQFTGQRGASDDRLRGMRAHIDGATKYLKSDKIYLSNPLDGWTDTMIKRYVEQNDLRLHPARERGAVTIGCLYCGGGAQFDNSGFKILREQLPDHWRRFIVDWEVGYIILSVKYDKPLDVVKKAVEKAGGLSYLAETRPYIFDYLRKFPLKGYEK